MFRRFGIPVLALLSVLLVAWISFSSGSRVGYSMGFDEGTKWLEAFTKMSDKRMAADKKEIDQLRLELQDCNRRLGEETN